MANIDTRVAQLQDDDLEPGYRPDRSRRRLTWYRRLVIDVRWVSGSSLCLSVPLEKRLSATQKTFISIVAGEQTLSPTFNLSCNWYIVFLEHKINEAWIALLRPILADIDTTATSPREHDISIAFQFLTAVVSELTRGEVALVEIVDEMYNKCILYELETDIERSRANQLVFAALGWISMLYSASSCPKPDCLQLECDISGNGPQDTSLYGRISLQRSSTFSRLEENVEINDEPLFQLLNRFGQVIPRYWQDYLTPQELSGMRSGRYDDSIDISFVCFHAVGVLAGIRILWVDCLSLHLEFDSRTKTLKLFRFPSLCLILYRNNGRCPLSQIFQDFAKSTTPSVTETDYTSDYFKEVLLSYRLLFGENNRSQRAFSSRITRWRKEWKHRADSVKLPVDPILLILGSQSWESNEAQQIYDEIEAEDPTNLYSATSHFAFFGKRLLKLQNYVRRRNSRSIRALLYDRKNLLWRLTFWAGGATLLFALLQCIFQIEQAVLAQQQQNQANSGSHVTAK